MNESTQGTGANSRSWPPRNLQELIEWQSEGAGGYNWICKDCIHYEGSTKCGMTVFIAFVGANMSGCIYYSKGRECPHCGRFVRLGG